MFDSVEIQKTDSSGNELDEAYFATSLLLNISYAKNITEKISLGGSVKYIYETIETERASTFSLDIGGNAKLTERFVVGATVKNLFGEIKFIKQSDKLPLILKTGAAYNVLENFITLLDVTLAEDNPLNFAAGVEYKFLLNQFVIPVRTGYRTGVDAMAGFSLGLGFGIKDFISLDLSWAPSVSYLEQHTFNVSLGIKF